MKLQQFGKFRDVQLIQPQRVKLRIPAFELSVPVWAGASNVLAQIDLGNSYYFSLKQPIAAFGANFCPAIRWAEDGVYFRFKLFSEDNEILYYPIYSGQRIGPGAVIEIWSVDSDEAPALEDDEILQSSVLAWSDSSCCSCCSNADVEALLTLTAPTVLPPYAYCNPFCNDLC